ncbi:sigma-70 family RNA polymerase sigma factor [Alkalibacterium sp. MB6]|uniref:sigma-70 family RNA polymerase sigma factor n=1 Tax=Alkalibacterium sp. MB6 TaxID=2081965 RepID=UPI00137A4DFC|nr:sigma-70 family RNA polymerase sigma factor [Alkalibacterium sp. MB6]
MDQASVNASKLIKKFTPLIHKTMHRLNISETHMLYDDFYQEFQIKLIQLYRSFDGDPLNIEADRYRFTAYAQKGLYWRGIDILKPKSYNFSNPIDDSKLAIIIDSKAENTNVIEQNHIIKEFISQAKSRLTDQEYMIFLYLTESNYNNQELADLLNVHRVTIAKRKKSIQKKLSDLKYTLMKQDDV